MPLGCLRLLQQVILAAGAVERGEYHRPHIGRDLVRRALPRATGGLMAFRRRRFFPTALNSTLPFLRPKTLTKRRGRNAWRGTF